MVCPRILEARDGLLPLEGLTGAQTSLNGNHWRLGAIGRQPDGLKQREGHELTCLASHRQLKTHYFPRYLNKIGFLQVP